jgi:thiamine biosynthesis protein ThiI
MKARVFYVVHYGEIALKGRNRGRFERALARNLLKALGRLGHAKVHRLPGRLLVETEGDAAATLEKVFGIEYFAEAVVAREGSYEAIREALFSLAEPSAKRGPLSFKVEVKRAYKGFPLNSMQLASKLGEELRAGFGWRVDLDSPELMFYVEVLKDLAILYTRKIRGPGGLPVGVTGRVLALVSGGIDSPVAAWLLMKRGCELGFLHFYAYPTAQEALEGKLAKILAKLSEYGAQGEVFLAPYHHYQLASLKASPGLELVLFKRFMLKVGAQLAQRRGYIALATGDGLAQVASQTLPNLIAQGHLLQVQVLRPLIAYDKKEIVELAKKIGTYELSLEPYRDCCSIIARHPETRASAEELLLEEQKIGLEEVIAKTLEETEVYELKDGVLRPKGAKTRPLRPLPLE